MADALLLIGQFTLAKATADEWMQFGMTLRGMDGGEKIAKVVAAHPGRVLARSPIGGLRVVEMLSGEQLPRIC